MWGRWVQWAHSWLNSLFWLSVLMIGSSEVSFLELILLYYSASFWKSILLVSGSFNVDDLSIIQGGTGSSVIWSKGKKFCLPPNLTREDVESELMSIWSLKLVRSSSIFGFFGGWTFFSCRFAICCLTNCCCPSWVMIGDFLYTNQVTHCHLSYGLLFLDFWG